jgi:deoxyuridine 5'-triphosphate nucleotidohydrolase
MNTWYELEILPLDSTLEFYPLALFNRSDQNAGVDLHASEKVMVGTTSGFIPFGITARLLKVEKMPHDDSVMMKTDSHFWLVPRSSIYKTGLVMANSIGVIDKSYRGELKAPVWSMSGDTTVERGDRLFQIVAPEMGWIRHIRLVDSLPQTDRGEDGFGSTGK